MKGARNTYDDGGRKAGGVIEELVTTECGGVVEEERLK
jgi:hypothetical protein